MLVRMAKWECKPEAGETAAELFENAALPILERQHGARGAMLLAEPGTTRRIAFTVWEDEASYRRFVESDAMREITEMFAPMYVDGALSGRDGIRRRALRQIRPARGQPGE